MAGQFVYRLRCPEMVRLYTCSADYGRDHSGLIPLKDYYGTLFQQVHPKALFQLFDLLDVPARATDELSVMIAGLENKKHDVWALSKRSPV